MKSKIYVCPYQDCGKAYSAQVNLKRHVECIHLRLKNFVCHFCNKQLSSKQNFREHLYIHTGEKPFVCGMCGDAFRQGSQLSQHKKIHQAARPMMQSIQVLKLTELAKASEDRFFNPEAPVPIFALPSSNYSKPLPDLASHFAKGELETDPRVVLF